ncbi:MAG: hypothetical protein Q9227_008646 [Pyrenula ochraceoflavens]
MDFRPPPKHGDMKKLAKLQDSQLRWIFAFMNSAELYPVLRVCRYLSDLALPFLCDKVILKDFHSSDPRAENRNVGQEFLDTLDRRPDYESQTWYLQTYFWKKASLKEYKLPQILRRLPKLDTWIARDEFECFFDDDDLYIDVLLAEASLPNIRAPQSKMLSSVQSLQLSLFSTEGYEWELEWKEYVFFLPYLRHLVIEKAKRDDDDDHLCNEYLEQTYNKTTNLESLRLEECQLHPNYIKQILQLPKSLKHFSMRNVWLNRLKPSQPFEWELHQYSSALQAQSQSLKTLVLQDFGIGVHQEPQILRTFFTTLEEVEMDLAMIVKMSQYTSRLIWSMAHHLKHLVLWCPYTFDTSQAWKANSNLCSLAEIIHQRKKYQWKVSDLTLILQNDCCSSYDDFPASVAYQTLIKALDEAQIELHLRKGNRHEGFVSKEVSAEKLSNAERDRVSSQDPRRKFFLPQGMSYLQQDHDPPLPMPRLNLFESIKLQQKLESERYGHPKLGSGGSTPKLVSVE